MLRARQHNLQRPFSIHGAPPPGNDSHWAGILDLEARQVNASEELASTERVLGETSPWHSPPSPGEKTAQACDIALLTTVGHGVLRPITSPLVIPVSFSGTQHEAHNRQRQADASNPHDQAGEPSFQTAWFAFRRMSCKPWSLVCHIPNLRSVLMRGPRSGCFREIREREVQAASLFGLLFAPRTIGKSHSPRSFPASHALVVEP
jgi:hypothetical protein